MLMLCLSTIAIHLNTMRMNSSLTFMKDSVKQISFAIVLSFSFILLTQCTRLKPLF